MCARARRGGDRLRRRVGDRRDRGEALRATGAAEPRVGRELLAAVRAERADGRRLGRGLLPGVGSGVERLVGTIRRAGRRRRVRSADGGERVLGRRDGRNGAAVAAELGERRERSTTRVTGFTPCLPLNDSVEPAPVNQHCAIVARAADSDRSSAVMALCEGSCRSAPSRENTALSSAGQVRTRPNLLESLPEAASRVTR